MGWAVFNLVLYAVIPEITQLFSLSAAATESCIQVVRAFNIVSVFSGEPALHCRTPCAAAATPFYDGSQHSEYVAVPRGLQLCAGAGLSCRIAGRLDWYVH